MKQIAAASILAQWCHSVGADVLLLIDDGDGSHQRAQDQFDVVSEIVNLNKTQDEFHYVFFLLSIIEL